MDDGDCWKSIQAMSTSMLSFGLTGSSNRYNEFQRLLNAPELYRQLRTSINPAGPGSMKLLGIKLYVYGFSRGAAAARAFVNWLSELLPKPQEGVKKPEQCLMAGDLKIPLSVEFLGLLDTVASVGIPHIAPVAEGHMGWADGSQALPDDKIYGGLIKKCVHMVSSHEQRLCFPLDSIRRTDGSYPEYCFEVIYPGMHSDIGGGYPPGDQGKARSTEMSDGYLLSQIVLHEMYAAAFSAGAPLKVRQEILPSELKKDIWRQLPADVLRQFAVSPLLVSRFNAWRTQTLSLPSSEEIISPEQAISYTPIEKSLNLEDVIEEQMGWITGWRIHQYAGGSYKTQRFYIDSAADGLDKHSDPAVREADMKKRAHDQKNAEDDRKQKLAEAKDGQFVILTQGPKDFDAALGQTQLRQAAEEFRQDYQDVRRDSTQSWYFEPVYGLKNTLYLLNTDDEYGEWLRMTTAGKDKFKILFPESGEDTNAEQPSGLLRALFDDQVHDSRAWFMHNAFGAREPWAGYFRYRMIYFDKKCNKALSPLIIAGAVVGTATLVGGVAFIIKQKGVAGKLLGAAGMFGAISLEAEAVDILSGKPFPVLPGAELLKAFTQEPGVVVAEQKRALAQQIPTSAKSLLQSIWEGEVQPAVNA